MTISLNFLLNLVFALSSVLLLISGIVLKPPLGPLDLLLGGVIAAIVTAGIAIRRRWV